MPSLSAATGLGRDHAERVYASPAIPVQATASGRCHRLHTWDHRDLRYVSWNTFKYEVTSTDRVIPPAIPAHCRARVPSRAHVLCNGVESDDYWRTYDAPVMNC